MGGATKTTDLPVATKFHQDFSPSMEHRKLVNEALLVQESTVARKSALWERTPTTLDPYRAFPALPASLPNPSEVCSASTARMVGFNVHHRNQFVKKWKPAKLSRKEAAHPFKFLWVPKFVTIAVVAPTKRLRSKRAWQARTAAIHLRSSATTVKLENQVRKERRNVKHGTL